MKILLDWDGVIVDYHTGIAKALNAKLHPWPLPGVYDVFKVLKIKPKKVIDCMENIDFWTGLKPYPYANDFVKYFEDIFGKANVAFITRPYQHSLCYAGKYEWLNKYFPNHKSRFMIGEPKEFLAHSRSILIDDHEDNCEKFKKARGNAIVFPQPWNKSHTLIDKKFKVVVDSLSEIMGVTLPPFKFKGKT